jgi:hypothetical protein
MKLLAIKSACKDPKVIQNIFIIAVSFLNYY